eukprot:gene10462-26643_t
MRSVSGARSVHGPPSPTRMSSEFSTVGDPAAFPSSLGPFGNMRLSPEHQPTLRHAAKGARNQDEDLWIITPTQLKEDHPRLGELLGPPSAITISPKALRIPANAVEYRWAFPAHLLVPGSVNGLRMGRRLLFGPRRHLPAACVRALRKRSDFRRVTIEALRSKGARWYCWVNDSNSSDIAKRLDASAGAFCYQFSESEPCQNDCYFALSNEVGDDDEEGAFQFYGDTHFDSFLDAVSPEDRRKLHNIENWLSDFDKAMRGTLRQLIHECVRDNDLLKLPSLNEILNLSEAIHSTSWPE